MKMRTAGRMRHMQGEKNLMVYRKLQNPPYGLEAKDRVRLIQVPQLKFCAPMRTGLLPIGSSKEILVFAANINKRRRRPEPTVQESKQTVYPELTDI